MHPNATNVILIAVGGLIIIFSFPHVRMPIMARLFNEGMVTPKRVKPEDAEIIKNTGPSITLFAIGVILTLIGIIIR